MLGKPKEVIKCRAAVLWKEGRPLTVENITVDPPKTGEVRVRMVSAGICATDAHFIWGQDTDFNLPLNNNPIVLGHEGAGIVESIGEGVTSVEVGDHVIPLLMPNCEKCHLCVDNPRTNICLSDNYITTLYHSDGDSRMHFEGKPLLSLFGISSFSEYSVIRETQIAKINPKANLMGSCLVGCAVGTGYGSVTNIAQIHPGASCAVWGLGAIGLSTVMACKEAKAKRIIGIDINTDKFTLAAELGCTELLNPKDLDKSLLETLQKEGGIDYAFDCIGNEEVLNTAIQLLTPWGSLTSVGLPPKDLKLKVPVMNLLTGQRISGGLFGSLKSRKAVINLVDKYVKGELKVDSLISHRFKLNQINEAFDLLRSGKVVRAIIEY